METTPMFNPDLDLIRTTLAEARETRDPELYNDLVQDALSHPEVKALSPLETVTFMQEVLGLDTDIAAEGSVELLPFEQIQMESLTPHQQAILHSHLTFDTFKNASGNKTAIKTQQQDATWDLIHPSLNNPDKLLIGLAAWNARAQMQERQVMANTIAARCKEVARHNWQSIDRNAIVNIIQASLHTQGEQFAHAILEGYFKGPKNKQESVEALARVAGAAMDLVNDTPALEKILSIAHFRTDMVTRDSDYNLRTASVIGLGSFDEPRFDKPFLTQQEKNEYVETQNRLLARAVAADRILMSLVAFTSIDREKLQREYDNYFQTDKWDKQLIKETNIMRMCLSQYDIKQRVENITAAHRSTQPLVPLDQAHVLGQWINELVSLDDLHNEYARQIQPLTGSLAKRQEIMQPLQEMGMNPRFIKLYLPTAVLEVCIPNDMSRQEMREVIASARNFINGNASQELKDALHTSANLGANIMLDAQFTWNDQQFSCIYRPRAGAEQEHSASSLELLGFPLQPVSEGETIEQMAYEQAQQMSQEERRFLMARGVRYLLNTDEFSQFPYESVIFRKTGGLMQAEINVKDEDKPYIIQIRPDFQLNLEGKEFGDAHFQHQLHLTLLKILEPLLCSDPTNERGDLLDNDETVMQVLVRCGHLRRLQRGQRCSQRAFNNYFEEQGGDLLTKDALYREKYGDEYGATYVRKIVKDKDAEPLPMKLPDGLFEN